jgi:NAD(P)H dehydrogenase (quinone)
MKIAILYHSESGNTKQVAQIIAKGAHIDQSIEIQCMELARLDEQFITDASAVILGSPTYCGSCSWQVKRWLDTTTLDLSGKLGSVFATENYLGGGADVAELSMAAHLLVHGMLVYAAGVTQGAPFTHYGAVTIKAGDAWQQERARQFGRRVAEKARELFSTEAT